MKVCHVTSSHNRHDGRIFQKECCSLASKYDVTLLCADELNDEVVNNVSIKSINCNNKNRYNRFVVIPKKLKKKCIEENADVYHFHDPELISLAGYMKKKGKKVIFDSHEDNVNRIDNRIWIPKIIRPIFKKVYAYKEKKVFEKLDAVITVTGHVHNRLVKINPNSYVVTNYPIISDDRISDLNNKKTLCFAGGVGKRYMHHNIIKAIQDLDVNYKIAGPIVNSYFETLKNIPGFEKVEYVGMLSKNELKDFYLNSGIGMVLIDYNPNINYKIGSMGVTKIFEYMEAGIPVIATDLELWQFIDDYKCGVRVNPNNIDEIKTAIEYIINNQEEALNMGKNGRMLVEKEYNWNTQEEILFNIYVNI